MLQGQEGRIARAGRDGGCNSMSVDRLSERGRGDMLWGSVGRFSLSHAFGGSRCNVNMLCI